MDIWGWIILGLWVVLFIFAFISERLCHKWDCKYCKYWRENPPNIRWGEGCVLKLLKYLFFLFSKMSVSRFIVYRIDCIDRKHGIIDDRKYGYIDVYVLIWLLVELASLISLSIYHPLIRDNLFWIPMGLITYRLFDIMQALVSQFILDENWTPVSPSRSLILNFLNYLEVTICYAFIILFFNAQFKGIEGGMQAWYYSLRNVATVGSDFHPKTVWGLLIFTSQIGFVILFVTAVVNSIIRYIHKGK